MFCEIRCSQINPALPNDCNWHQEAKCPFCQSDYDEEQFVNDYSTKVLLLCMNNNCNAVSFLDCDQNFENLPKQYLHAVSAGERLYKIPLLKILRTTGDTYYEKSRELTDEECRSLFSVKQPDLEKFGLTEKHLWSPDIAKKDIVSIKNGMSHLVSLPCNSYDLFRPVVPYPKYFSQDHDGGKVFVLLENGASTYLSGD
jgi:hypothetical protein